MYQTVTLTGTYQLPDGSPAKGPVDIIPSEKVIIDSTGDVILSGRVKVQLDETGSFSVALPATDDPTLNPTGFGYTVSAKLHHQTIPAASFSLPAALGTVDIADLTFVDPSTFTPGVNYVTPAELDAAVAGVVVDTSGLEAEIATKADAGEVSAALATKAAAADVDALEGEVAGRLSEASLAATYTRGHIPATFDRAGLAAADAAAIAEGGTTILLRPGTYAVGSDLTVVSPVTFQPGAVIRPNAGVKVTLAGGVAAGRHRIADHSAGGTVIPQRVDYYHPAWWGAIGTADDSATWAAMTAAIAASRVSLGSQQFGQRIMAPAGVNRLHGVTLTHCALVANLGVSVFTPPETGVTSGSMITVSDYASISGGWYATSQSGHAVVLIDQTGYRTQVDNVMVAPGASGATGLKLGSTAATTTTPVANDVRVYGSGAASTTGIDVQSADYSLKNPWVTGCTIGINWQRGAGRASHIHVWGNTTGMTGSIDQAQWDGVFLDTNNGWGADLDVSDQFYISGMQVWKNGLGVASTGGIRFTRSSGSGQGGRITGLILDDNTGVGMSLENVWDYDIDARVYSRSVQGGGAAVCATGISVDPNCRRVNLRVAGLPNHVTGTLVSNPSGSASVTFGVHRVVTSANVVRNSSNANIDLAAVPILAGARYLVRGCITVDGSQTADAKMRLQATGSTGATGWFGFTAAPAVSSTSATAASVNPSNGATIAATGGAVVPAGLLGVGSRQVLPFTGHLSAGTADGTLVLQVGQNTSDATDTTFAAGSWLEVERIA